MWLRAAGDGLTTKTMSKTPPSESAQCALYSPLGHEAVGSRSNAVGHPQPDSQTFGGMACSTPGRVNGPAKEVAGSPSVIECSR